MESSVIYVSRQTLPQANRQVALGELVAQARWLNAQAGISGSLVCTVDHFAQLIEGPSAPLMTLMGKIERDSRHADVTVLRSKTIAIRHLADWSMAYSGPASYVARFIKPLVGDKAQKTPAQIDALTALLIAFASIT